MSAQDSTVVDGVPHLAFFDGTTSFVWTGRMLDPIEISPGGYAEPVTATIEPLDVPLLASRNRVPVATHLEDFRQVCQTWVDERDAQ
jgi:hypothetical protein